MTVKITNERPGSEGENPFADLFRLQTEFQTRLAEETLRYLRRISGALGPAAPGTVVVPDAGAPLSVTASPGERATLTLELENLQRVHCVVTPQLSPLVSDAGATWFPATEPPSAMRLVAPGETVTLEIGLRLPADLPPATYRGALVLQGFRNGAVRVAVTVPAAAAGPQPDGGTPKPGPGRGRRGRRNA